ncbi:MAG: type II toxin-antitoxin system VapC family toxin [Chloroflexi bacterium]|nr:type II toxin-antitoxin system VapC family toxin [Chloroflexota bacterium]
MSSVVLDASALMALLNGETGAQVVAEALGDAVIGSVNLAEVLTRLAQRGLSEEGMRATVDDLEIDVIPFDKDLAVSAGMLWPLTRAYGLSLGDRACLALARQLEAPALTADRIWAELNLGIEVQVIR